MGVRVHESWQDDTSAKIDNFSALRALFYFVTWTDRFDFAVANQNAPVANNSKFGQFVADARPFRPRKTDELRRVKKSDRAGGTTSVSSQSFGRDEARP